MHVRDGDQADLETLLRLLELTAYGLFFGPGKLQVIHCRENVEIAFRDAKHEFLFRRLVVGFSLRNACVRLPEAHDELVAVDRLRNVQRVSRGAEALGTRQGKAAAARGLSRIGCTLGLKVDVWQQLRTALRLGFTDREARRLRRVDPWIVLERQLVTFDQIRAVCRG